MHLTGVTLYPDRYPTEHHYPFNLQIFHSTKEIEFNTPVTFFIGENGTGKSTLLHAIAKKCGIYIWKEPEHTSDKYSEQLYRYIQVHWAGEPVSGSFFASERFQYFAQVVDRTAITDPGILKYYGGEHLTTKSHGQCNMAYFKSRYKIKGLYFLDEPETALSPKRQLELLKVIDEMSKSGHAQFLIATHSPILMALPGSTVYSFDDIPIRQARYEDTDYYQIYRDFLNNREKYFSST
ncbi:AAA family ATPase [Phosphitispora sp. TUW77]|uniref:AAA family ATPase n=1 Tax=Phosphitispora sp. TUW77 TaxID=3152361 RepID=UPI003AB1522B